MLALSVSISTSGSPRFTSPPSSTSHLRMVPSSMESERRGMVTSVATAQSPVPSPQSPEKTTAASREQPWKLGSGDWKPELHISKSRNRGVHDMFFMRKRRLLQRLRVGHRHVGAGHPLDGRV